MAENSELAYGQFAEPYTDINNIKVPDDLYDDDDEKGKIHNTRSRAVKPKALICLPRGLQQYRVWDPGKNTLKTMIYPYHIPPKALNAKIQIPAGMPMSPSLEFIQTMDACDVERVLPRHWHETKGHPFEPFLIDAQTKELQDCCNRDVWGEPQDILPGMIIIGLMWVYAVKAYISGLFERFRARITLLGNQERHILEKLTAYAPVAQSVTARILIVAHLHIKGIFFRKL